MTDLRRTVEGVELHKRGFGYAAWIDTLPLAFVQIYTYSRRYKAWRCYLRGSDSANRYGSYNSNAICSHKTLKGCVANAKQIIGNKI